MSEREDIRVVRVGREDLKLEAFLRKDAAQAQPGNAGAPQAFVDGVRKSLDRFDFLPSDSHWLLAAGIDGQYVGYLTAVRIHKADGRVAVLYVDELMVLDAFRRRGVASALWQKAHTIANELGVWRIRVTVDPVSGHVFRLSTDAIASARLISVMVQATCSLSRSDS